MENSNPIATPLASGEKLTKDQSPKIDKEIEIMKGKPFQEAVGGLLCASHISRPDISYAVSCVSRFHPQP